MTYMILTKSVSEPNRRYVKQLRTCGSESSSHSRIPGAPGEPNSAISPLLQAISRFISRRPFTTMSHSQAASLLGICTLQPIRLHAWPPVAHLNITLQANSHSAVLDPSFQISSWQHREQPSVHALLCS